MDQITKQIEEERLLARVKDTPMALMRPRLCQVFKNEGRKLRRPRIMWQHYAGMGDHILIPANRDEARTAKHLIENGKLVPLWEGSASFYDAYHQLVHFDDLHWARTKDGKMIIYDIVVWLPNPDEPDRVIAGEKCPAALKRFQESARYCSMEDDPITLKGFGEVTPILTDRRQILLRQRQRGDLRNDKVA